MSLAAGSRLGSHEILGLLGAGGMGEVYLAQDTKLNRRVAIKVLPEAYASDPDRIARFHREAQAVAALNHTSIAAIYDLAEADGTKYLVLELIEGDTLADRLKRGPIPVDEALQIAKQTLEALEAAHEKGICHRDLKPANIKLTPDGGVKVLDFGLAKFLQNAPSSPQMSQSPTLSLAGTYPGVILGTAGYMSPEQAKGFEADQRSDIFSFGCILFEMLTGRQAFEGETASEILASVLKIEVDLTTLPPRLNPRLVDVLRRCLEKNPKKRWHAAADVRNEIESVMGRASIVEEARPQPVAARSLWTRALAAAALVAIGAAAGYATWALRPQPAQPVMRFAVTLPDGQTFTNTQRRVIALSPDGSQLVYGANNRLYLRKMSELESRPIAGTESPNVSNPTFSPDGQSLVFTTPALTNATSASMKRIALSGGAAVTIADQLSASNGVTWDPRGVMFGQTGKGILMVSPNGGQPELLAAVAPDETASSPQILPDGRNLLFTVKKTPESWDKARVVVQPLAGGEPRTVIDGGSDGRYVSTGHLVYALGGILLAVPFDAKALAVKGGPVPIVEGIRRAETAIASGSTQFAYASTGAMVYLPGAVGTNPGGTDLAFFDRKGAAEPLKLPPANYRSPRISPDGKWVAFDTEDDAEAIVFVYELGGTTSIRRLTFGGKNRAPLWSHDGEWIAFQSDREGDLAIFRQRADGSGTPERLTKAESGEEHIPQSWSPDGTTLLFTLLKDKEHALWTMTLKDRRTAAFGDARSPGLVEGAFSPDGKWVAYQLRSGFGASNVAFVEPFPRTGAKYQVPLQNAGHPHWSRKGDELIFNGGPERSVAIGVTTVPRVAFARPTEIIRTARFEPNPTLSRRNVDSVPGGDRLLGVLTPTASQGSGALTTQITVVINWFDDLRQRVPVP